jgi:hypothetical protein
MTIRNVAELEDRENEIEGRKRAFELFDNKFGTSYTADRWDSRWDRMYPRGFICIE